MKFCIPSSAFWSWFCRHHNHKMLCVYQSVYTKACIPKHVYQSLYTKVCIPKCVYQSVAKNAVVRKLLHVTPQTGAMCCIFLVFPLFGEDCIFIHPTYFSRGHLKRNLKKKNSCCLCCLIILFMSYFRL